MGCQSKNWPLLLLFFIFKTSSCMSLFLCYECTGPAAVGFDMEYPETYARHGKAWLNLFFIAATMSGDDYRGMSGPQRALCYELAIETGYRLGELRSLTRSALDLDGSPPTVTLRAEHSKRRSEDTQAIKRELAEILRMYTCDLTPAAKLFPHLTDRGADMLKQDLEAAGIPYKDENDRVFDFHGLRGESATLMARAGVSAQVVQRHMRLSTIELALKFYTHIRTTDTAAAVEKLPDFGKVETEEMKATGTDDSVLPECLPFSVQKDDTKCNNLKQPGKANRKPPAARKPSKNAASRPASGVQKVVHPEGFEPSTRGLRVRCSAS